MGAIVNILGPIVAQMGLILLRERFVRKVFAETGRAIAKSVGEGATANILNAAADELDPPKSKTSLPANA